MALKFKAVMGGGREEGRREGMGAGAGGREENTFPGEKLPEHHFKKKYFNAEFQRQQGEQERREGRGREEEEERRRGGPPPPRDPRYEQAMRAHQQGRGGGPPGPPQEGPRPQGPHFRGIPYTESPRGAREGPGMRPQLFQGPEGQRPQMYPGPPGGPRLWPPGAAAPDGPPPPGPPAPGPPRLPPAIQPTDDASSDGLQAPNDVRAAAAPWTPRLPP